MEQLTVKNQFGRYVNISELKEEIGEKKFKELLEKKEIKIGQFHLRLVESDKKAA